MADDHPFDSQLAPGRVAWHCTCFNTRRASRALTRFYDRVLAPSGVSITQFSLLGAVDLGAASTITEISHRLSLDPTTLSRNLQHAEMKGLIDVSPGRDKRQRVVVLTDAGRAALQRAVPLWHEAQARIIAAFGEDRWRRLTRDLHELATLNDEN